MSKHPDNDELLRYAFGLDDEASRGEVEGHLGECLSCRSALEEIEREEAGLKRAGRAPQPRFAEPRISMAWHHSSLVPLVICVASAAAAGILGYFQSAWSFAAMALGAVGVTAWLFLVISRIEQDWAALEKRQVANALPDDPAEQLLFIQGLKIAAEQSIAQARRGIFALILTGFTYVLIGGAVMISLKLLFPIHVLSASSEITQVLFLAVCAGALLAGLLWGSLRLKSLTGRILRVLNTLEQAAR